MKSEQEQDEALAELSKSDDPDLKDIAEMLKESKKSVGELKAKSERLKKAVEK